MLPRINNHENKKGFIAMRRVLIWKPLAPGSEYDIYRSIECSVQYEISLRDGTFNIGNRLWLQGIMMAIDTGENIYDFLPSEISTDEINQVYDFIILPMANIFNRQFVHHLESMADTLERIHIPVFVIACGAQANSYEGLDDLVNAIGTSAKRFIRSIYNTGGEFALRGEFTKRFFERLGFSSAVVTGCPSLYQFGREFRVPGTVTDKEPYPVFNGQIASLEKLLSAYPKSNYMDQDGFLRELYEKRTAGPVFRDVFSFFCNYDPYAATLLAEDRIKLIPDMNNWRRFLMESGSNYAFGSRIHGNIISLLSGIPATVIAIDTRTMEMADFFNIPYIEHQSGHVYTQKEFETAYAAADYKAFNQSYQEKYDAYANFLTSHGIVSKTNQSNAFFNEKNAYMAPPKGNNTEYYQKTAAAIRRNRPLLACAKAAAELKGKLLR